MLHGATSPTTRWLTAPRTMVAEFAGETPGADVIESARTAVRCRYRSSAVGQVTADQAPAPGGAAVVMMPPELVNRAARYLEAAAASLVNEGVLLEDSAS